MGTKPSDGKGSDPTTASQRGMYVTLINLKLRDNVEMQPNIDFALQFFLPHNYWCY